MPLSMRILLKVFLDLRLDTLARKLLGRLVTILNPMAGDMREKTAVSEKPKEE